MAVRWGRARGSGSLASLALMGLLACSRTEGPEVLERDFEEQPSSPEPQPSPPVEGSDQLQAFELRGTTELRLSPEGYFGNSLAVAPDGGFALTAGLADPETVRSFHLGRYTPQGKPVWTRTVTTGAGWYGGQLAITSGGDVLLWAHQQNGGDLGSSPLRSNHLLVRYAPDGRPLWGQDAMCDAGPLSLDASGSVTVLEGYCVHENPPAGVLRYDAEGSLVFRKQAPSLGIVVSGQVTREDGTALAGGSSPWSDPEGRHAAWRQLGPDGTPRASGGLKGLSGYFEPLLFTRSGDYLALVRVFGGESTFAGKPVQCVPSTESPCAPLLLHGNVDGREDSVAVLPRGERILWVSPSAEVVTLSGDEAGTGSILRRRSATTELLATHRLHAVGGEGQSGVRVAQVAPLPDGALLVLGTVWGEAELGGTRVTASRGRLFLLRVEL
ncbi:hypothetical protein JRI60_33820 [Archangium violaceum]|uniref:hypothetical protein n=1 Tax=Archangium violaceum TaxID=83451 RepID=UPI00194F15E2|nr:hypothetical protein [Archangium violaceum]QRN94102.1 hypothetical protein JRI60_33820 [Archangium violaceum]